MIKLDFFIKKGNTRFPNGLLKEERQLLCFMFYIFIIETSLSSTNIMSDIDSYLGGFGFPIDQVKFLICVVASYPLATLYKRLPNSTLKHIMSVFLGILYCHWSLGEWSWIHSFISSLVVYLIVSFLPRRNSHLIAFTFSMIYLSVSHWYRMYTDYMGWKMDYTSPQMVLTLKLTSFAWNYYDGQRASNELTPDQAKKAIKTLPSLLEFFGFVYFFPTFLAGPTIEISDYLKFTSLEMFTDKRLNGLLPKTGTAALKTFLTSLLMFPGVILSGMYPASYFVTTQFAMEPIWLQLIRVHAHIALTRFKYYFGWYISEGSAILTGIGYNGFDKNDNIRFDRITNVNPVKVELASNIRDVSTYWNIGTSDWLKNYVYLRLTPVGSKPKFSATLLTYVTSAFWHGFYPGYYIFFFCTTFLTEVAKDIRRKIRPYFVKGTGAEEKAIQPQKKIYDIVGTIVTAWWLNLFGASFILLSLEPTLVLWSNFNYIPVIMLFAAFIFLRFVLPAPRPSKPTTSTAGEKKTQ
ncbi:membrane bound O-acyl transferase family protein [Cavenderia fasciculata]|uniref:Membrane bound O-acyl transferase family protein n=1 Tax=Cavenderia fasciculata TaxID=261658 RepID=F4Q2Y1_CACFS|nr:membrane bound O-acyl transferase family protein [Cavenderia fasciculata]EGG17545.1 membrane bound O-acyl transferase family protein [Cavenderia fasciculata]|eukprot:XP_004356029.1 membrane bound O-acyl transferase family protein [Cavenderia fasciculata]